MANIFTPPYGATVFTPIMGKQTAVMAKPTIAQGISTPAKEPKYGGKIRFPAPKNIEKSVNPNKSRCLKVKLFDICNLIELKMFAL